MALAVVLGALTVVFGAGLMATAGYLITRAAEQPAILSLMTAIVAVRFFGIARPLARYFERLASHDLALRVLGRVRVRVYERIEPLAPAQLDGYSRGDLLSRMVADVDALQNLYLRGVGPPLVALLAGALCVGAMAAFLPAAALVLALGLLAAGIAVPVLVGRLGKRAAGRQAAARGALSTELVELLGAAPELVVYGGEAAALGRLRAADRALVRIGRRDALAGGRRRRPRRARGRPDGGGSCSRSRWVHTRGVSSIACSSRCSPCSRSPRSRRCSRCRRWPASCRRRSAPAGGYWS